MSKWNETGILRKKQVKDNFDDLLVFGYACKLFKDDEKATYVDQGKHLIPWMGDEKIKIDRYDGRGALSDLSSCEASKEGFDAMRWLGLSDTERKLEQLCDDERYYSLIMNEEEEAIYKEEETKRQKSNEFHYSYDVPRDPEAENSNSQDSIPTCEADLEPFVPPTELDVPVDINIPKTVKVNARIEKTALFVSKQGPQMEILIKAKQSDNPQFNFMNQSDTLYKYYRHVLSAIKNGRYKTQAQQEAESKEAEARDAAIIKAEEYYLHPTLAQPQAPPLVNNPPKLPPIPYKPAANCAYTQLISRIQGNGPMVDPPAVPPPPPAAEPIAPVPQQISLSQMTHDQQQQYYQYYYSMQYYEYYKQITQQYAAQAGCDPQTIIQNPQLQEQIQTQAAHYAQTAYNQYIQQNSTNSYSQIVTNLAPSIMETAAAAPLTTEPLKTIEKSVSDNPPKLLSLVHYSSDSEDEESDEEPVKEDVKITFKVPPDDTATIIDKMANYVSKNGADFENIVRAKGDPRFQFLNDNHEFFNYYKHKLSEYSPQKTKEPRKINAKIGEKVAAIIKEKKVIAPVSFSLKKPKEETEIKSGLPLEESDDETEEKSTDVSSVPVSTVPSSVPAIACNVITYKLTENQPVATSMSAPSAAVAETTTPLPDVKINETIEVVAPPVLVESVQIVEEKLEKNAPIFDDPILEMIDLTDDLEERRDARRAENKIKDKLALAAKEKLSSKSRDRALQMERRKKAAMFLKLKSVENHPATVGAGAGETRTVSKTKETVKKSNSSDSENRKASTEDRVGEKREKDVILKIDDSESEEGEIKHRRKSGKKKKSHKRKTSRSRSRYDSKTSHHSRRSKKRKKRASSHSSTST